MNVELGAGLTAAEGYLAVDVNPRAAHVVADARSLPFADASVSALRCVDVLEHISYLHTDAALAEWRRVLQRGGRMYVQVPDAGLVMRLFAEGSPRLRECAGIPCEPLYGATWRLLGGHGDGRFVDADGDWRWNAHYSLWDRQTLTAALDRAGFRVVELVTNAHPNLLTHAEAA